MTFPKLTYRGSTCNNYLYFAFNAEYFDTTLVTRELDLEPTSVMIKKDPVPRSTSWKYQLDANADIDVERHLQRLVSIFENKVDTINRLKEQLKLETRLQFVMDIDIDPEASTPYFGLNERAIDFLGRTRTTVDFDLYKADTLGLLNNAR